MRKKEESAQIELAYLKFLISIKVWEGKVRDVCTYK
jgi:hypothetical protein